MSETDSLSPLGEEVKEILTDCVDGLNEQLSLRDLEAVLSGDKDDLQSSDLGSKPETYAENNLIYPLLEIMGLAYTEQPYGGGSHAEDERDIVWPDFELDTIDEYTIGENKPFNNIQNAHKETLQYLDRRSIGADYAIATDGFTWWLYKVEQSGDRTSFPRIKTVELRELLRQIALNKRYIETSTLTEPDIDGTIEEFVELFEHDAFQHYTSQTAPIELRDSREADVEEFYQLYIEYLFGESDEHDEPTCLMDDIRSPRGANEHDERKFAITLMNRLLFIKFLEKKEVIPPETLIGRVRSYESEDFTGNFYDTQIKPLFYDLFNKEVPERESKHQSGWFEQIPYLNGGLFRPNIDDEERYQLEDRTLPDIIRNLIEGHRLSDPDGTIDPSILGSVFERTINHIGGEFGTQKDIGAYYTPGDVTELITQQVVDPKARDVIIDSYAEDYDDTVRGRMEDLELGEILRRVEDGEGWFGDADGTRRAYDRLGDLRVVDPACGSGHFLTTVMEEIQRIRRGLLRGLNRGEDPDPETEYESKRELALNSIFGVDVDPIGVEIARLRVWLKIVEDDWDESFGRLPNIELNVVSGNSLIGLPTEQTGQTSVSVWDDRLDELVEVRKQYKQENPDVEKQDVLNRLEELRDELDEEYLQRLTQTVDTSVETANEWAELLNGVNGSTLHPTITSVKLKRDDEEAFSDSEKERLSSLGFSAHTYSARLNIERRHDNLRDGKATQSHAEITEQITDELTELIEGNYWFEEVERQPLQYDLDNILGDPFHWIVEFPEVAKEQEDGNGHTIEFDIVLGNPPYGDIMRDSEKTLASHYTTGDINDVSAPFVERQIRLLGDGGHFGNITTLGLVYSSNLQDLHDFVRENIEQMDIACFAHRPQQVFPNAIVRVAIMTGQKTTPENGGTIQTSKFLQFDVENRKEVFEGITYLPVEGLELRERIGGSDRSYEVLPKVGDEEVKGMLESLESHSDLIIGETESDTETDYPVYRRRGGGYWLNAVPENIHGDVTTIEELYFDTELEQQTVFLIVNSSLFYVYWIAYADFRHLNTGHIRRFPIPPVEELREYEDEILDVADRVWTRMEDVHAGGTRDQFDMPAVKPLIDEADELLSQIYDTTEDQLEYVQNYNSQYGRRSTGSTELSEY
ncbi:N-6 DNA methylase [Salinirubellus salinus]|uniref:site-specific DNA-methyltransferase (adenine-specific) n=1 Tax=Salinirubellus salinus TaxID=1364945 RepID=A0A9E7R8W9_9EURY|nr:N-6 DNA methylase [Salinirubellus salinus]UWM56663.1 N-6 DNA methylase [Salinirubellus salinus]